MSRTYTARATARSMASMTAGSMTVAGARFDKVTTSSKAPQRSGACDAGGTIGQ